MVLSRLARHRRARPSDSIAIPSRDRPLLAATRDARGAGRGGAKLNTPAAARGLRGVSATGRQATPMVSAG